LWVFPVPPFEAFWLRSVLRGEIDGAAENIQDASILMLTAECAKLLVKPFGVAATQSRDAADT
jgi:hypothetical protein